VIAQESGVQPAGGGAIRAILLDLDGTLMDYEGPVKQALAEWLPDVMGVLVPGFGVDPARLGELQLLWLALEDKHYPAWRSGEISVREQRRRRLRDFLPEAGVDPAEVDLDELFLAYLQACERHWAPYPDAAPALERIAEAGLRTAVLSNGSAAQQRAKLAVIGLISLCGPLFSSEEIGFAKPDLRAYAKACELLGLPPEEVLMVGDNYELDVLAPRSAGLSAVHLVRTGTHRVKDRARIRSLGELTW
jgi:putative hydrolase of the HAD superfamily